MSLDSFIAFLAAHQTLTLVILFCGAYFETLIVTSFFVYGEFFFLAGAILAGLGEANIFAVSAALYAGGILGDHSSYWIGRIWGDHVYVFFEDKFLARRFFTKKNYARGTHFFKHYGGRSVLVGRFLGPVSWITPFLAGVFKLSYGRFSIFEFPAAILGIGQFLVVGYIFGKSYTTILHVVQQYLLLGIFIVVCLSLLYYFYRRLLKRLNMSIRHSLIHYLDHIKKRNTHVLKRSIQTVIVFVVAALVLYSFVLALIFFVSNQRLNGTIPPDFNYTFGSIAEIVARITTTTYYQTGTIDVGPINVVIISTQPLATLVKAAHWLPAQTFLRNDISLRTYVDTLANNSSPVSDLYFSGVPQDYAYLYTNSTLLQREHIRFWNFGTYDNQHVYIGAVSRDDGLDIYHSLSFIVPYHATNPNVDASRAFFIESMRRVFASTTVTLLPSHAQTQTAPEDMMYYTDNKIAVIQFSQ